MKTEISYNDLINSYAPLVDVSIALDRTRENVGDSETFRYMDDKVKRALVPLKECIERIEKDNPDQSS